MKCPTILLVFTLVTVFSQPNTNTMSSFQISASQELTVTPSSASTQNDFDFLQGRWKVKNQKLRERLSNSTQWDEFESTLQMKKTGLGNVENYFATFNGKPFEGLAIRLFNPQTKLWTIYWMDTNSPVMDQHPVTGSFENGVGKFYATDRFTEKDIVIVYQWDTRNPEHPVWSQAFSTDNGKTWEWNWEMVLSKIE
jgi:hypothetical protein